MTDGPEAACPATGRMLSVDHRREIQTYEPCRNCFDTDQVEDITDIPRDYSLVRTASNRATTVHRDADDVDEVQVHNNQRRTYSKQNTILEAMTVDEFDEHLAEGGDADV